MEPSPLPQLRAWLRLTRSGALDAAAARALIDQFGDVESASHAPGPLLARVLGSSHPLLAALAVPEDEVQRAREAAWFGEADSHVVSLLDDDYPPLLHEIADPPVLLYVKGDRSLLAALQLAIVGSRNPTAGGADNAGAFAQALAEAGLVVTSGLALGIDAAAHEGALHSGRTIAVAGTGLDRVYPPQHRELAHRIAKNGALVSEFPLGAPPLKHHFPKRNRLIAGMSIGTLVVEAALRSGSLITARLAAEQGREVFAIPGSIHSPLSKGCHQLIRQGAKLVETAQDIVEELGSLAASYAVPERKEAPAEAPTLSPEHAYLLECMGFDPVDVDTLVDRSGLTPGAVSSMLLGMELAGLIQHCAGGRFQRSHA